jgi:hypothetical protein
VYLSASFSPQGNYVVIQRDPVAEKYQQDLYAAQQAGEIVMMRENGQDFHILPLPVGPKTGPIMSNNEDKIAYWTITPHESTHESKTGYDTHIPH